MFEHASTSPCKSLVKQNLYDLDRSTLTKLLGDWGYSEYYADLLWQGMYRQMVLEPGEIVGLRPDLVDKLEELAGLTHLESRLTQRSADGTRKFLLALSDGETVETVVMPYRDRYTACISTQVGCAMGCTFCATGQMGFKRQLTPGEIVGQVMFLHRFVGETSQRPNAERRLRNVVFMGMGEPLHNYSATMQALSILIDHGGLAFAPRHLTISTVGLPGAIRRLTAEKCPANLAVSLHGATDEERNRLVPIGRRLPLADLMDACREYCRVLQKRLFIEWALIAGENDSPAQAHALGSLLHGLDAHVNLIPLNPIEEFAGGPSRPAEIAVFQSILSEYNLPSTVRQRRGIDIDAGCGQLRARVQ